MSGAKAKMAPEINLEEFERRLRAASAPHGGIEDPLAELTRLVDNIASDRPADEKVVELSSARMPKAERLATTVAKASEARRAPEIKSEAPTPPPMPDAEFGAEEMEAPALRSAIEEGDDVEYEPEAADAPPPARRASSWYLKVGALASLAVIMGAGAVVLKVGMPGRPKSPPMILADSAPTKVAPPTESAVQSPSDSGSLLLKDSAAPPTAPVKIVNHEEQPVDLGVRAPVAAAPAPTAAAPTATASPVAPTSDTPIVALAEPTGPAVSSSLTTEAKPVKTVSVRPDGTLISVDTASAAPQAPAASNPVPPPQSKKPDTSPLAATPTIDLPAKPSSKSSARVTAAKTDTTVPADAAPQPLGSSPRPDKAAKLPTKLRPPAADATVADATPPDAAPAAGGGQWSVQFAAPRSESDAQSTISRLKSKYGDALSGAAIGVHKAEVHGESIYRVRASGLSKADAAALCSKLKDAGGDCFLAKN